jgi:4-hydroxy-tetrahydrodipicolinate synthase
MKRCTWTGTFVVMVTPFNRNGSLDTAGARALADLLIGEGADGLVVAGSTGEWFTMTLDEKARLFQAVSEGTDGRVPILAGVSALATADSLMLLDAARDAGHAGALVLPPPYVLPTQREVDAYFAALDAKSMPLMLYNNPPRTGVNLTASMMTKLARFESVVAMKDSVKDIAQTAETIRAVGDTIAIFTGLENYAIASAQRGAAGVVAMAPNVMGRAAMELYRLAASGSMAEASAIQARIDLLYHRMYGAGDNPYAVLKACMGRLGRPAGPPRPPILPVEDVAGIDALLRTLALTLKTAA